MPVVLLLDPVFELVPPGEVALPWLVAVTDSLVEVFPTVLLIVLLLVPLLVPVWSLVPP